jgi:branched-chain amino acid aminotransferase
VGGAAVSGRPTGGRGQWIGSACDPESSRVLSGTATLASLDGEIMPAAEAVVPATDEGLLRGDGVFEVIRVYDGRPFALEEHLARLERSATNLRLPLDLEAVRADAHRLLAHAGAGSEHEALRIVLTRGGRRILLTEPLPPSADRIRLASITYAPTRILDGVKSLSYAANMLASRLAREQGFDEALLVTPHGRVLEAPTSSIFWIKEGAILTPPLDEHILASITRAAVIELTGAREQPCTLEDLEQADEAFLASTTREVQPVAAIDERSFDDAGPITAEAAAAMNARIRSELGLG